MIADIALLVFAIAAVLFIQFQLKPFIDKENIPLQLAIGFNQINIIAMQLKSFFGTTGSLVYGIFLVSSCLIALHLIGTLEKKFDQVAIYNRIEVDFAKQFHAEMRYWRKASKPCPMSFNCEMMVGKFPTDSDPRFLVGENWEYINLKARSRGGDIADDLILRKYDQYKQEITASPSRPLPLFSDYVNQTGGF